MVGNRDIVWLLKHTFRWKKPRFSSRLFLLKKFKKVIYGSSDYTLSSQTNSGAITKLTIAITFIKIFIAGPEVSFKGSPTVSPTTTAV